MADLGALLGGVGIGGAIGKAVAALEELGDTGTLSGDELRAVLTSDLPAATSFRLEPPRLEAAASAASGRSMKRQRLADAASGGPRLTSLPAGASRPT